MMLKKNNPVKLRVFFEVW